MRWMVRAGVVLGLLAIGSPGGLLSADEPAPSADSKQAAAQALLAEAETAADEAARIGALERALSLFEGLEARPEAAATLRRLGEAWHRSGDRPRAREFLERALGETRRLRLPREELVVLRALSRHHLEAGRRGDALRLALTGLGRLEGLLGALSPEEEVEARATHAELFRLGLEAALGEGDASVANMLLEAGRALSMVGWIGGRQARLATEVPEGLRQEEEDARSRMRRAQQAYAESMPSGSRRVIREALAELDAARTQWRDLVRRIQREQRRQAGLFSPRASTVEEIRGALRSGETFVSYALGPRMAVAIVSTRTETRVADLGPSQAVREAASKLTPDRSLDDWNAASASLRALAVEPLGLPPATRTVLISPAGPLFFVPPIALFPDRDACFVPSGSTLVALRGQPGGGGEDVLAVGDPDYGSGRDDGRIVVSLRGRRLVPLPATRAEAEAVGDVVLVGVEASEARFTRELGREAPWRAVHFAGHALVDDKRPMLSALALAAGPLDDGLFTVLELLRLDLRADLVSLAATNTARGRVVEGEGLIGFPRGFLMAGARRVIGTLWAPDDCAARALMVRFYEGYDAEDPTARQGATAALRQAQADVRSDARWAHPRFWAGWVLWGLP